MVDEYKTLQKPGTEEIIIEKSRFIGYSTPVSSEDEAIEFINEIKAKHNDATHNIYAYVIGFGNEIQRYNDDGEPSGTAGMPALEVLKREDLRNVVVVITRYFGGIKLGAGGLIRAYTKGAKIAVDAGVVISKRLHKLIKIVIDYTLLGKVQNEILQNGYPIKEIKYDELVHILLYVPIAELEIVKKQLTDWTNGRCEITEEGEQFL